MKKVTAIIAVRKGSKRIPEKNIRPFAGTSLLEIKLKQLCRIDGIDEIIVSTDCEKMSKIATSHGAVVFMRDARLASDHVPMNEVYEYLAGLASYEHVMYVHVTSPLLKDTSIDRCIREYQNMSPECDSLATVKSLKEYLKLELIKFGGYFQSYCTFWNLPKNLSFHICLLDYFFSFQ